MSKANEHDSLDALFSAARAIDRRHFLAAGAGGIVAASSAAEAFAQPAADAFTEEDRKHMTQAIDLMRKAGVTERTGGAFGAVIVRGGEVLSATGNSVLRDNDP